MIKVNGYESEIDGTDRELVKEAVVALNHVIETVSDGDANDAAKLMCRIVSITCKLLKKEGIDIDKAKIIKAITTKKDPTGSGNFHRGPEHKNMPMCLV